MKIKQRERERDGGRERGKEQGEGGGQGGGGEKRRDREAGIMGGSSFRVAREGS